MKKFLTLALALAMVLSLSVNIFAEEQIIGTTGGSSNLESPTDIPVSVTLNSTPADTVYRVDIQWESLSFTWSESSSYDVSTHNTTTTGSWNDTDAIITVTNHSNSKVNVTPSITPVADNGSGVTASLSTTETVELLSAEGTTLENAPHTTFTVSITNQRPNKTVTIANVKLTLADPTVTQ